MHILKKSLMIGAGVATLGVGSLGAVSAATTSSSTTPSSSIVDKIASTFNLDKTKVQAVFDQQRASHQADMQAKRTAALNQAVTDGKLTQTQADYITKAWADIDSSRPSDGTKPTDAERQAMDTKRDALQTWLKAQNIDLRSIVGLQGHHGHRGDGPADDSSTTTDTTVN